ncbi:DUF2442 domain-containing protein [Telmatobacter bradus]|uniref:DUF2442 domain-containing protein n=1 Tax=Telmatobacter bradus TaxID=474953 RepID=UPI003B431BC2
MPETARVVTTDEEIDAALRQAIACQKYERRVRQAAYLARTDRIQIKLDNGVSHSIPRRLLQGLAQAAPESVGRIEILGSGTGLYWPDLDVAHELDGLLAGIYGSAGWMEKLRIPEGTKRLSA